MTREAIGNTKIAAISASAVLMLASAVCQALPAQQLASAADLADLTLEQLANVTVTSASRRSERLLDAPASIFVVTADDIRRAGATTLRDALVLAPNLQVVRGDANQMIASSRGGLLGTANKMLVLVDGRTVYTPLFAGVFYDALDLMIEDIDRIEVISGPGSTLWGTNAVNGVINITTRSARATQGMLATVVGGSDRREVAARVGARLGDDAYYRVYAKYGELNANRLASGATVHDASDRWLLGFRTDARMGTAMQTIQGDAYGANVDNLGGARDLAGGNLRGRWSWQLSPDSDLSLQSYYDRTERSHAGSFRETRDTVDVELQHSIRSAKDTRLVWGADYRASSDHTGASPTLAFLPAERVLHFASLYLQDERALSREVKVVAGLRAERNDYTGIEWLPNLRLSWSPGPETMFWSAITRAVRAPSRIDRDLAVPGQPPFVITPNDNFQSEIARVVEVGWRQQWAAGASLSVNAFHHDFRKLRTLEPAASGVEIANGGRGSMTGMSAWADAVVTRDFRLKAGALYMRNRYEVEPGRVDVDRTGLGNNPNRTAIVRASWNPATSWEVDATVRHVGPLPRPVVPGYTVADLRIGWRASKELEISLIVDNVLDRRYSEFGSELQRAVFERAAILKVTWTPF